MRAKRERMARNDGGPSRFTKMARRAIPRIRRPRIGGHARGCQRPRRIVSREPPRGAPRRANCTKARPGRGETPAVCPASRGPGLREGGPPGGASAPRSRARRRARDRRGGRALRCTCAPPRLQDPTRLPLRRAPCRTHDRALTAAIAAAFAARMALASRDLRASHPGHVSCCLAPRLSCATASR